MRTTPNREPRSGLSPIPASSSKLAAPDMPTLPLCVFPEFAMRMRSVCGGYGTSLPRSLAPGRPAPSSPRCREAPQPRVAPM